MERRERKWTKIRSHKTEWLFIELSCNFKKWWPSVVERYIQHAKSETGALVDGDSRWPVLPNSNIFIDMLLQVAQIDFEIQSSQSSLSAAILFYSLLFVFFVLFSCFKRCIPPQTMGRKKPMTKRKKSNHQRAWWIRGFEPEFNLWDHTGSFYWLWHSWTERARCTVTMHET